MQSKKKRYKIFLLPKYFVVKKNWFFQQLFSTVFVQQNSTPSLPTGKRISKARARKLHFICPNIDCPSLLGPEYVVHDKIVRYHFVLAWWNRTSAVFYGNWICMDLPCFRKETKQQCLGWLDTWVSVYGSSVLKQKRNDGDDAISMQKLWHLEAVVKFTNSVRSVLSQREANGTNARSYMVPFVTNISAAWACKKYCNKSLLKGIFAIKTLI